ncbi:MAG: phage tail protein I [Gemmatirosa sp.]
MRTASTAPNGSYRPPGLGTLVVSMEGTAIQAVPLADRVVTIGRLPENVITLPHQAVSRRHAEVRVEGAGALLTDVGSAGGTFVDGVRLAASQPFALEPGSSARIGPYVLTYTPAPQPAVPAFIDPPAAAHVGNGHADGVDDPSAHAPFARAAADPVDRLPMRYGRAALLEEEAPPVESRRRWPAPVAGGPLSHYLLDLPALFQENDFLGRMLLIYESIWEPLERRQDHLPLYFDPRTCPAELLPWLARWLELQLDPHWPESRRRALVAEAMELYRWRGTAYGMTRMLEVCTGITPTITEDPAQPYTFRIRMRIPVGQDVRREVVEELVRAHKPAHVGYVLELAP